MIARLLQPFLIALAAVLGISAAVQTLRLSRAQHALADLQQSITAAAQQSQLRAATTGQEAVSSYAQSQQQDAPLVERVVTRVRNVCLRQPSPGGLPVPAAASEPGQARRDAQDDADRAAYLSAVADDLRTCQSELNRLDAIRQFHNANVGEP